jgi:hypothetical protein
LSRTRSGAVTLGDLAGKLELLRVECKTCGRAGQYRVLRLIKELGAEFALPEFRARVTADCPRRPSLNGTEQC